MGTLGTLCRSEHVLGTEVVTEKVWNDGSYETKGVEGEVCFVRDFDDYDGDYWVYYHWIESDTVSDRWTKIGISVYEGWVDER